MNSHSLHINSWVDKAQRPREQTVQFCRSLRSGATPQLSAEAERLHRLYKVGVAPIKHSLVNGLGLLISGLRHMDTRGNGQQHNLLSIISFLAYHPGKGLPTQALIRNLSKLITSEKNKGLNELEGFSFMKLFSRQKVFWRLWGTVRIFWKQEGTSGEVKMLWRKNKCNQAHAVILSKILSFQDSCICL